MRFYNEEDETRAWSTIVNEVLEKYNDTPHSSTGYTPRFLMFGKQSKISPIEEGIDITEARRRALVNSNIAHERNKRRYDRRRKPRELEVNELVYVENGNKMNRRKMDPIYIGPFRVQEKLSPHIYRVESCKKRKENNLFHVSKLVPFMPREGDVN
jgi:hypothetical protein